MKMVEQLPPLESGTNSINPLTTNKNMMQSPSALEHSNEGDEPGSGFMKSIEQKLMGASAMSPLHANIVKRTKNNAATIGGMGGQYLNNNNIAFTGTIGKNDWLVGESPYDGRGRAATNQMLGIEDKGSSAGAKNPTGHSKNDYLSSSALGGYAGVSNTDHLAKMLSKLDRATS